MPVLPLTAYRKYNDDVRACHVPIQRDVTTGVPSNYQFTLTPANRTADEGTVGQDLDRLDDLLKPRRRIRNLKRGHVLQKTVEIVKNVWRQFDVRHHPPRLRGSGLSGRSPRNRASNQT